MALIHFRTTAVRQHGLPQVCLCCGNDQSDQLVAEEHKGSFFTLPKLGCCLISVFFTPIAWIFALAFALRPAPIKHLPFSLPICRLCLQARSYMGTRLSWLLAFSAVGLVVTLYAKEAVGTGYLVGFPILFMLLAVLEHYVLSKQFSVAIRKSNNDEILLQTPFEDYPALYQRHLDNALLYGSSEHLGTRPDE